MSNIGFQIEFLKNKLVGESTKVQSVIYGARENIYFLGNGFDDTAHLIISETGDYKVIKNPLSQDETTIVGHLEEFLAEGAVA